MNCVYATGFMFENVTRVRAFGVVLVCYIAALLASPLPAFSAESAPGITCHLTFDNEPFVVHASGCPDTFCRESKVVDGKAGKGLAVYGKDNSLQLTRKNNLNPERGAITLWFKPDFKRGKDATYPIAWVGNNQELGSGSLWLWMWKGILRFDVRDPDNRYCSTSVKGWKPGEWVHIAAGWDCSSGLSLWVNGVKCAQRSAKWKPEIRTNTVLFGAGNMPAGKAYCDGVLDEIKIFDRPLSAAQVMGDYSGTVSFAYLNSVEEPLPVAELQAEKQKEKLEVTFSLDFENGFKPVLASGKTLEPLNKNLPKIVEGKNGKGVTVSEGQVLRFPSKDAFDKEKGAMSIWVKTPNDFSTSLRDMVFFREDGPEDVGKNSMWFWMYNGSLRADPRDPIDNYVHAVKSRWGGGEWHHVVVNWDCNSGMVIFIDGKRATYGGRRGRRDMSLLYLTSKPTRWIPRCYKAFFVGAHTSNGQMPWEGVLDDMKFYNRPLTGEEVCAQYAASTPLPLSISGMPVYPYVNEKEFANMTLENLSGKPQKISVSYAVKAGDGRNVCDGSLGEMSLGVREEKVVAIPLDLPEAGMYTLDVTAHGNGESQTKQIRVAAVARVESAKNKKTSMTLLQEIDVTDIDYAIESAPSRIVDSPLGKYREAGDSRTDRFAVKFDVKEPHQPHFAVVEYPDDKERTMEVLLQPLEAGYDYQAQTGVFTGDEYPISNSLKTHTVTFWPQCEKMSFIFMTNENKRPAAVKSIKIYRMEGGFNRLAVNEFRGSVPARRIGLYHEDPVLHLCYGRTSSNEDMTFFPGFATSVDRMIDYHQSFGMDTLHYPIAWYYGPLYGSDQEFLPFNTRKHPYDYPKYLLRRLAARGMKFNAWLHMHQIESITPYVILDEERVFAGEETPINMRMDNHLYYTGAHGCDPVLNPIDPHAQEAIKNLFVEILARYGDEPAFTGITLNTVQHSIFAFGSIESGYNDINLKRFQQDTGIKIPVSAKDRFRFAKSAKWLLDNAREEWVNWRCVKLREYYKDLAKILTDFRKDLTLGVVVFAAEGGFTNNADYLNDPVLRAAREQGLDPLLYKNDSEIVFRYSMVPADLRWQRGKGRLLFGINDLRTVNSAPETMAPIAATPSASINMHDRYFENAVGREKPLKNLSDKTSECRWRVSAMNGNDYHSMENFAFAMNNMDPLVITKGGFLVGTMGVEPYLAKFAQAFRALPAVKFDDVKGMGDPMRVRQKVVDGSNYIYALNRLPYPVKARILIGGNSPVVDVVSGVRADKGGVIDLQMSPYEFLAFRADGADALVVGGSASVGGELIAEMVKKIDEADRLYSLLDGKGIGVNEFLPYLQMARRCLAEKRYARLYFLLQESWPSCLRQLAGRKMQAFFTAPENYMERLNKREVSVNAVKASVAPEIDGRLDDEVWARAQACSDISDFIKCRGEFLACPATAGMSVKIAYDEKNLYFAVRCEDDEAGDIIVRSGLRDAALWHGDDAVEIFLRSPAFGGKGHAHFAVNAGGSRTDLFSCDLRWNTEWRAASKVDDKGWQTEMAIPYESVRKGMSAASGWAFNIARTHRGMSKSALIGDKTFEWKNESRFASIAMEQN